MMELDDFENLTVNMKGVNMSNSKNVYYLKYFFQSCTYKHLPHLTIISGMEFKMGEGEKLLI